MAVPATLNGYSVIYSEPRDDTCFWVIVHRPGHPIHPYVLATWFAGDTWSWGQYCETLPEAMEFIRA